MTMTDFYKTLGVSEGASPDDIKKAYRKLANQHHPDKGGDQAKFKDISVAYDTLSNPQKKADYDQQRKFGDGSPFHFNTGGGFHDVFGGGSPFGDIFGFQRRVVKNRDLNIQCQISLLDSFLGKQLEATYKLPSGKSQTVVINLPEGINHGDTIRYQGLGDDTMSNMPRGSLNITVIVLPDPSFERRGDDLYTTVNVTPIEAMIGCRKKVFKVNGQTMDLDLKPGIESGVEYASNGNGFKNPHTGKIGRFVTVVKIQTPAITDPTIVSKLKTLNEEINKTKS
jgi:curved DNA-binding protein